MHIFFKNDKKEMKSEEVNQLITQLRLPTSLVFTPINLREERKKFFESETYEPNFRYKGVKNSNENIFKKLSSLKLVSDIDPRLSDFYIQLIESKKESNDLINAVGNNELMSEISYKKYGKPSALLFRNSARVLRGNVGKYNVVKAPARKNSDMLNFEEIQKIFDSVFEHFGLDGWKVQASSTGSGSSAKVGIKSRWVLLDPNIEKSKFKLKKTLVHEVGTHVLRSVNGSNSGFPPLSNATLSNYLDIEEGLATWNESDCNLLTLMGLKKKAALTYAIYIGEKLSFRQLYNSMLAVLPKRSAFNTTYRVKRGLGDTSYPGIYSKDIVYFRGYRKVKKALEKDKFLYEKLYAGKIDIAQSVWVDEGLIRKAQIVPSKEQWGTIFRELGI